MQKAMATTIRQINVLDKVDAFLQEVETTPESNGFFHFVTIAETYLTPKSCSVQSFNGYIINDPG